MPELSDAWMRCRKRFSEVSRFVDRSAELAPEKGESQYRAELYGSWVLASYGACQYAIDQLGQASIRFIGSRTRKATQLPEIARLAHYRQTIAELSAALRSDDNLSEIDQRFSNLLDGSWSECTPLMRVDRNVWGWFVREWLKRIGVQDPALQWMSIPVPGGTETYESRMNSLVAERNPIAHGEPVTQVLSANLMRAWIDDCSWFVEQCAMTISNQLVRDFRPQGRKVGEIDKSIRLGDCTVALAWCSHPVEIGSHVIVGSRDRARAARIESMQSNGKDLALVPAGTSRVAITLNRRHENRQVYLTP